MAVATASGAVRLAGEDRKRIRLELIVKGRIVAYKQQLLMPTVRQSETFSGWLHDLADGNPGDVGPVGEGVSELRLHYGPGYRVYFVSRGAEIVLLLCGGDKSSQARDIETARRLAIMEE